MKTSSVFLRLQLAGPRWW